MDVTENIFVGDCDYRGDCGKRTERAFWSEEQESGKKKEEEEEEGTGMGGSKWLQEGFGMDLQFLFPPLFFL